MASISSRTRGVLVVIAFAVCGTSASAQSVLHLFEGQQQFDFLGWSVDGAGDVDGDGCADLIVGALGYQFQGGRAEVFSGKTGAILHTLPASGFSSAAGAGDVDRDGRADLIVGHSDSSFGQGTGRATVHSGRTGLVLHTFTGKAGKDYFGASVDGAGDVDGDGFDDFIVGAHQTANPNPGKGYAQVRSGQTGGVIWEFTGSAAGDNFGSSVAGVGDVDADGFDDVVVGAWRADPNGADSGTAIVFSGATGLPLHVFDGAVAGNNLGRSVAGAGDVNGDGHADVFIGIPGDSSLFQLNGAARVFSGLDGSILHEFFGDSIDLLGSWVSGAGEVTGDCFPDLIVGTGGSQNYARVFSGSDGSIVFTVTGTNVGPVAGAGDVNNDGVGDVIVGDPVQENPNVLGHEEGRATVYSGTGAPAHYCTAKTNTCGGTPAISSTGIARASASSGFVISASGAREGKSGLLLYGQNGPGNVPFQGGILCVSLMGIRRGAPVVATSGTPGAGCDAVFHVDWNTFAAGLGGGNPAAFLKTVGQRIDVQWWGRDSVANGSFLSDALFYLVCP